MPENKTTTKRQEKAPENTKKGSKFGGQFMQALTGFFEKKNSSDKKKEAKPNVKKVKKSEGLSLLLGKYVKLARSGVVKGKAPARAASASAVAEVKTEKEDEKVEEQKNADTKGTVFDDVETKSADAENKEEQTDLSADFDLGEEAISDEELEGFIEIPEELLAEAKDLEIMAKDISKEELEEAAEFLGVFKDKGMSIEQFKEYVPEDDSSASKKQAGMFAGSLGSLGDFVAQQKKLLEMFSSLGSLSLFKGKNAKKLKKLMDSVPEDGEIVVQKKSSSKEDVQVATPQASTSSKKKKSESSGPGDPTQVDADNMVLSGAAALEQQEATDDGGLALENLSAKEQEQRRLELDEDAKELSELAKIKASKETVADIKREGLGIDLEAIEDKPKKNKVSKMELREEIEDEDFLESTTASAEKMPIIPESKLTPKQRKALQKEQAKQAKEEEKRLKDLAKKQKEEEKRWAEEAKRREKLMKKKEEERKKAEKQMAKGDKIKVTAPKKIKKQSALKSFLNSLNYMGMSKERVAFIANLGTMMDAGLPLLDALKSLEIEAKNKVVKKLMNRIITAVELGSPLWRAMEAQYFFQPQQIAMVKVGEEAGNLVENLAYLTEQSEKDEALRAKIKTAMIYPIIIFTMLTAIIMGLGIFVLPNLIQVIYGLGVPLPVVTRGIIMFTNVFQDHGTVIVPGFFGGIIFIGLLNKYTSFKVVVQWLMYKVPGIGALLKEATLSRFGVIMSGLLQAGLPVTEAIESLANVTPLVRYKKFYYQLLEHIKLGDSFRTSFKKIKMTDKCFPTSVQQLVTTGEQSGSLAKIMGKIADIHDKRATDIAEKLPVILEPMLLLFIGSLVGTIALGILAPIYSIVGNIG